MGGLLALEGLRAGFHHTGGAALGGIDDLRGRGFADGEFLLAGLVGLGAFQAGYFALDLALLALAFALAEEFLFPRRRASGFGAALFPCVDFHFQQAMAAFREIGGCLPGEPDHAEEVGGSGERDGARFPDQRHEQGVTERLADDPAGPAFQVAAFHPIHEKHARCVKEHRARNKNHRLPQRHSRPQPSFEGEFHHAEPDEADREHPARRAEDEDLREGEDAAHRPEPVVPARFAVIREKPEHPPIRQIRRAVGKQRQQQDQPARHPAHPGDLGGPFLRLLHLAALFVDSGSHRYSTPKASPHVL